MKSKKIIIGLSVAVVALALLAVGAFTLLGQEKKTSTDVRNKADVEWYNENGTEFTITTAEELFGLVKLAEFYDFQGQTIKLGADIVVNEGDAKDWEEEAPALRWYPINNFGGTFDGQGYTISGLYGKDHDTTMSMFAKTQAGCVIQNFRLVNSYFECKGNVGVASIGGQGGGTFKQIYSSAIVKGEGKFCGGILSRMTGLTIVEECWFDGLIKFHGRMIGGIAGATGAKMEMSHCLYTGDILSTWSENATGIGGLIGCMEATKSEIYLTDCLSVGTITANNPHYLGSVTGILYGNSTTNVKDTYASMDTSDMALGRNGVQGGVYGAPIELLNAHLIGENAYKWTNLDFENYWAIAKDETPVLKHFAKEVPSVDGLKKEFNTDWYDENAKEMVIRTKEELYGLYFVTGSYDMIGQTVKIDADITVNEGNASKWGKEAPEGYWYPIKKFGGTIDGQGHTISGLYYKGANEKVGFVSETLVYATVKNLSLKNSYFEATSESDAIMGSISGRGGGTFDTIYTDAILVSKGNLVGGIIGQINKEGKNKVTNCWFDGSLSMTTESARYGGGIAGNVVKGETVIEHCLNTGTLSCKAMNMGLHFGGLVGTIMNEGTILRFKDCLNVGMVKTDYHICVGSVMGRITSTPEVYFSDTYAVTESYLNPNKGHMGIGSESAPTKSGGVMDVEKSKMTGYGGYQWTSLDFKNYWSIVKNGTPILKSFASSSPSVAGLKKMADYSWYNESKSTYVLDSTADLIGFAMISKTTDFKGKTIKLGKDITLNTGNAADWATKAPAIEWMPANKSVAFEGTFDGQGHTISGLYVDSELQYTGLFGRTALGSTVKNLRLVNSYFNDSVSKFPLIGSIAGRGNGTFDTIYSDAYISSTGSNSGGITGWIDEAGEHKISNCWYAGTMKIEGNYAGGIAGEVSGVDLKVDNCLFTGTIISTTKEENGAYTGGLIGHLAGSCTLKMEDCLSAGLVKGNAIRRIGTIIGQSRCDIAFNGVYTTNSVVNMLGEDIIFSGGMNPGVGSFSNNSDGTRTPYWEGAPALKEEDSIKGIDGYKYTALDFYSTANAAGKWVVRNGNVPALKSFVAKEQWVSVDGVKRDNVVVADTSWVTKNAGTQKDPYIIADAADLFGVSQLSKTSDFKGKYFKVTSDIIVNTGDASTWGSKPPVNVWIPIGRTADTVFAGVFDGQGHTISGLYTNSSQQHTGLFGRTAIGSTVKNLKLTNSYFVDTTSSFPLMGSIAGIGNGTFDTIYSDAYVVATGDNVGGLIGWNNEKSETVVRNCWYAGEITSSGQNVGGILGRIDGEVTSIESCLFTGSIVSTCDLENGAYAGGMIGRIPGVAKLIIADSLSAGNITVNATLRVGMLVGQSRGDIVFDNTYTTNGIVNAKGEVISFTNGMNPGVGTHSTNSDGTKTPTWVGAPYFKEETSLLGTNGYRYTALGFYTADNKNGKWVAVAGKTPSLKSFTDQSVCMDLTGIVREELVIADTSWVNDAEGTEADPYIIADAADLYGLSKLSETTNFAGKHIKVVNDIVVNKNTVNDWKILAPMNVWTPIGKTAATAFAGTFDGQGHTISGIYVDSSEQYVGLFGRTAVGSMVKNLRLENSWFKSTLNGYALIGGIAGKGDGTFDTIYTDAIVEAVGNNVGGFVGWTGTAGTHLFKNCWFDGTVTSAGAHIGGILGYGEIGPVVMDSCLNTGVITSTITMDASGNMGGYVGGLIGRLAGNASTTTLEDCLAAGEVRTNSTARAAMVIGCSRANLTFVHVHATNGLTNVNGDAINFASGVSPMVGTYSNNGGPVWTGMPQLSENILGVDGFKYTSLTFYGVNSADGAWVARAGKVPALKAFVPESEWIDLTNEVRPIIIGTPNTDWINKTAGTEADPYIISTPEELYGLAQLSASNTFSGKYIKLVNDIIVNSGEAKDWATKAPQNIWSPISPSSDFAGTFDGAGHTVSGLYFVSEGQYVGMFGRTAVESTIKNLRLENSYFNCSNTGFALTGSIAGKGNGNFDTIYSNAIVVGSGKNIGGIVGWIEKTGTHAFTNIWFDGSVTSSGQHIGGILGHADAGPITFKNCLNSGTITSTITMSASGDMGGYVGGLIGRLAGAASPTTLDDCLNTGNVITNSTARSATLIGCTRANSVVFIDTYTLNTISNTSNAAINFSGGMNPGVGTFSNNGGPVWSGLPVLKTTADLKGVEAYKNTNLGFYTSTETSGAWVARKDTTPALKAFVPQEEWADVSAIPKPVEKVVADTSWNVSGRGTEANPYLIADAGDLLGLAELSASNGFSGKYFKLVNDIVYNVGEAKNYANSAPENIWSPIGKSTAFAGTFDGDGYTISGLYTSATTANIGLFGNVSGVVKNLRLENSYFKTTTTGNAYAGSIAGFLNGTITNIYSNAIVVSAGYESGGMVGRFGGTATRTISNCWFDGSITATASHIGGFVGSVNMGNKTISNCLNTGTVTCTWTSDAYPHVGGFAGSVWYTKPNASTVATTLNLDHCLNAGKIVATGTSTVGAVVGRYANNSGGTTYGTIQNVYYTKESYNVGISTNSQGDITGTTTNIAEAHFTAFNEADLFGLKATSNTKLDFGSIWAARDGKIPAIKSLMGDEKPLELVGVVVADTSWLTKNSGTEADPYLIADAGDLLGLAKASETSNFSGKYIKLAGDVVMNGGSAASWATQAPLNTWSPIGRTAATAFAGTFDGDGHTISGLYVKSGEQYVGLFGRTAVNSTVKNLRIENSYLASTMTGYAHVGSVAGKGDGNIDTVYSNAIIEAVGNTVGGFVGWIGTTGTHNFTNCWFDGKVTSAGQHIGGIIAHSEVATLYLKNCLNTGVITSTITMSASGDMGGYVGGIIGRLATVATTTLENCLAAGEVKTNSTARAAMVIGCSRANLTFINVYATNGLTNVNGASINFAGGVSPMVGTYSNNGGPVWTGTPTLKTLTDITGDAAKTNLSGFDFTNTWTTVTNGTPVLKCFAQ